MKARHPARRRKPDCLDPSPAATDPAALARAAILASGRAMKARLWAEARSLAGLAESYARLAVRTRAPEAVEDPTEPGRRAALAYLRSVGEICEDGDGSGADFSAS